MPFSDFYCLSLFYFWLWAFFHSGPLKSWTFSITHSIFEFRKLLLDIIWLFYSWLLAFSKHSWLKAKLRQNTIQTTSKFQYSLQFNTHKKHKQKNNNSPNLQVLLQLATGPSICFFFFLFSQLQNWHFKSPRFPFMWFTCRNQEDQKLKFDDKFKHMREIKWYNFKHIFNLSFFVSLLTPFPCCFFVWSPKNGPQISC